MGAIAYSDFVENSLFLNTAFNQADLRNRLLSVQYQGRFGTNTASALREMRTRYAHARSAANPGNHGRWSAA